MRHQRGAASTAQSNRDWVCGHGFCQSGYIDRCRRVFIDSIRHMHVSLFLPRIISRTLLNAWTDSGWTLGHGNMLKPQWHPKKERKENHNTTQHNTTQHKSTQHKSTQHNTTQHNTTQHNTTQHNTTLLLGVSRRRAHKVTCTTQHISSPRNAIMIAFLYIRCVSLTISQ